MTGKYHLDVPRDPTANLEYRLRVLGAVRDGGPLAREAIRQMCAEDCLWFINVFVWQFNPNEKVGSEVGPFVTWDFQDEAVLKILWCVENRKNLVIEKSREMGASWLCLIVMLWLWRFQPWKKFLLVSRSAEAVDKAGEPDSLFWKLDFILDHLPHYLLPRGWSGRAGNNPNRRDNSLENPENRSTITGQASTGKAGQGGRATAIFIDEFSLIREDYVLYHNTTHVSDCRIFNGTHRGTGTCFAELCDRNSVVGGFIERLLMHWSQHPVKNPGLYYARKTPSGTPAVVDASYHYDPHYQFTLDNSPEGGPYPALRSPWYDEKCRALNNNRRAIAMDLDIDPKGSTSQFFPPELIRELQRAYGRPPDFVGDLRHDDLGNPQKLVPLPGGPLSLWFFPTFRVEDLRCAVKVTAGHYTMGCDLSWGQGATPTCFSILRADTGEKVGEYVSSAIWPTDAARLAVALCRLFSTRAKDPAWLAWEQQGPGIQFGDTVKEELSYRNIYYHTKTDRIVKERTDRPGFITSATGAKEQLLTSYLDSLHERRFLNPSVDALEECLEFAHQKGGGVEHGKAKSTDNPAAAAKNHGDRVIADALAWLMARELGFDDAPRKQEVKQPRFGTIEWYIARERKRDEEREYEEAY